MKLWEKGYKTSKEIEKFTVGEDYILDQKLIKYDCIASIAHAKMLGIVGILKKEETERLVNELNAIMNLDKNGEFKIQKEDEDCHTAIENYLTKKLGKTGKKIHTARSRNDQVLVALRLYYKNELIEIKKLVNDLMKAIHNFIKKYHKVNLPGYTHMRKAMPSSIKMWGDSFIDAMKDNSTTINHALELIDQSPLGTGAGYGIPLKIDMIYTAGLLGFKRVQKNPIYAQNSRGKFESMILHALTQIMYDLNRTSSDIILFSMPEFSYFELPLELCTGSSIMPQKKNPDVLELLRAKSHAVISCEFQVKNITNNLISGYNRDIQLTKKPTIEGIEITKECLFVMIMVFNGLKVNKENCSKAMTQELYAAEEAYKLVKKGVPFREAYQKVGKRYVK